MISLLRVVYNSGISVVALFNHRGRNNVGIAFFTDIACLSFGPLVIWSEPDLLLKLLIAHILFVQVAVGNLTALVVTTL